MLMFEMKKFTELEKKQEEYITHLIAVIKIHDSKCPFCYKLEAEIAVLKSSQETVKSDEYLQVLKNLQ